MEMLIYILNVGAVLCMYVTTLKTDMLSGMNEMALKRFWCAKTITCCLQNYLTTLYTIIATKHVVSHDTS